MDRKFWKSKVPRTKCLAALTVIAWALGCTKSERYSGSAPLDVASSSTQIPAVSDGGASYPKPTLDLPAERLAERVDGAEVQLRALGCRRLRLWRLEQPHADLELLSFASDQGARQLLAEQAGQDRSPSAPGDEGWIGANALYFRKKRVLVRLVADGPETPATLLAVAHRFDRALGAGTVEL